MYVYVYIYKNTHTPLGSFTISFPLSISLHPLSVSIGSTQSLGHIRYCQIIFS